MGKYICTFAPWNEGTYTKPGYEGEHYEKTFVTDSDSQLRRFIQDECSMWRILKGCRLVHPDNPEWSKAYDPYASGKDVYESAAEIAEKEARKTQKETLFNLLKEKQHVPPYVLQGFKPFSSVGDLLKELPIPPLNIFDEQPMLITLEISVRDEGGTQYSLSVISPNHKSTIERLLLHGDLSVFNSL